MAYQAPSTRKPVVAEHWTPPAENEGFDSQLESLAGMKPVSAQTAPAGAPVTKTRSWESTSTSTPNGGLTPIPPLPQRDIDTDLSGLQGDISGTRSRASEIAGLRGQAADPAQKAKPSTLRKVLGAAAGVGATLFTGNPLAGYGAYRGIADDPERNRLSGIAGKVKALEGQNASAKDTSAMENTKLDFISSRTGQNVTNRGNDITARGQEVTLAGQQSATANNELTNATKTIKVPIGNGKSQTMQFDIVSGGYTKPIGEPEMDNDTPIPVTPEMIAKFPDLKGTQAISQTTWEKLANPSAAGADGVNMQNDEYDLKSPIEGRNTIMASYKPRTGQYVALIKGVETDITDKIKGIHRQPSAGVQVLTMTNTSNMPEDIRDAFNRTTTSMVPSRRFQIGQMIDDQLKRGDFAAAKQSIKQASLETEPTAVQATVTGRRELMAQTNAIRAALKEVPTSLIAGTVEQTIQRLGKTGDPKYASLITRMGALVQTYRKAMTGAQFSVPESKEYSSILPSSTNDVELNIAIMDGLAGTITTADTTYWNGKFSRPGWGDFENTGFGPGPNLNQNLAAPASQGQGAAPAAPAQGGAQMIEMITPDGRTISVHISREKEAISRGAKRK